MSTAAAAVAWPRVPEMFFQLTVEKQSARELPLGLLVALHVLGFTRDTADLDTRRLRTRPLHSWRQAMTWILSQNSNLQRDTHSRHVLVHLKGTL